MSELIEEWFIVWKKICTPIITHVQVSTFLNQLNVSTIFLVSSYHVISSPNHSHEFISPPGVIACHGVTFFGIFPLTLS